jgi:hypothetical protein
MAISLSKKPPNEGIEPARLTLFEKIRKKENRESVVNVILYSVVILFIVIFGIINRDIWKMGWEEYKYFEARGGFSSERSSQNQDNRNQNSNFSVQKYFPPPPPILDFGLGLRPNSVGGLLSTDEERWCLAQLLNLCVHIDFSHSIKGMEIFYVDSSYNNYCYGQNFRTYNNVPTPAKNANLRNTTVILSNIIASLKTYADPSTEVLFTKPTKLFPVVMNRDEYALEISLIQQYLAIYGYKPGPIDGIYGKRTAKAIMWFQANIGIYQDGAPTEIYVFF